MGQEKYEVWFAGIRGLGARKKYLLHEALKSCRNAYYIEETLIKIVRFHAVYFLTGCGNG